MTQRTYGDVVAFEVSRREAYSDLSYVPVFRASAIFYARVEDGFDTELTFLNYWSIKNGNDDVSLLLSVRDAEGSTVRRLFAPVRGFVDGVRVSELVETPFEGSIEAELHSSRDLKYAMPAIVVGYHTRDGVSFVHSNQRVFNDLADQARNIGFNPGQTGFDVRVDGEAVSYLTFVNGPLPVERAELVVDVVNASGAGMATTLDLGSLPAYATRLVSFDAIRGAAEHLDGQPGFARVDAGTTGVFNRLAVGTTARDRDRTTVTHSFYDCSNLNDYVEAAELPPDDYHAFLPLALVPGVDLEVVLYPIYSPVTFRLQLLTFDGDRTVETPLGDFDTRDRRPMRLPIARAARAAHPKADDLLHCVVLETDDGRVPARVTVGLNYEVDGFGSNVNDSVALHTGYGVRDRLFAWGPVFLGDGARNVISIAHLEKRKVADGVSSLTLRLYDRGGVVAERELAMANRSALNLEVEELVAGIEVEGRVLWYTLESSNPSFTVRQVHVSARGFVGADHSF